MIRKLAMVLIAISGLLSGCATYEGSYGEGDVVHGVRDRDRVPDRADRDRDGVSSRQDRRP